MKSDSSKVFSTIFISFFAIGITCVFFFSFVDNPKPEQLHGVYGLIVVGIIFTILAASGEFSKKEPSEGVGRSSLYRASFLYFVVMAFVSLLYILRWSESISWFYALHILSFLALSIVLIAASTSTATTNEISTKKVDLSTQVKELRSRLSILCLQYSDAPWHTKLVRCQEEVGLFNTEITVPSDVDITRLVEKLEKELQRQKERAEATLLAIEEERAKREVEKKDTMGEAEEDLDDVEGSEDFFMPESEDKRSGEDGGRGEEVDSSDIPLWVIEEDEDEEPSDIPALVEELKQFVHQRNIEAKEKQKGKA